MLKGREGRPQGLEDQGVKNRKRPTDEGAVRGQKQWGLWHCGAGRKIRPVRKPEKGESKGWEVLCVQGCLVLEGVGWLEKILSDEDDTWGWLCCKGGGTGLLGMGQDSMGTVWVLDKGAWYQRASEGCTIVSSEALVPSACHRRPGAS